MAFISKFTAYHRYIREVDNEAADALFRVDVVSSSSPFSAQTVVGAQAGDKELHELITSTTSLKFTAVPQAFSSASLFSDNTIGTPGPFVTAPLRKVALRAFYDNDHSSVRPTQRRLTVRFVWPRARSYVRHWTKEHLQCHHSKVHPHTVTPLLPFRTPYQRFDRVHIDRGTSTSFPVSALHFEMY